MKTKLMSLLVILVALLSCDESLQVDGPKIPEANKTVSVTLSNIPAGFTGGTVYLITLNNQGTVYAIQAAEALEGAVVQIAPVPGFASFDVAAIIPTVSDWSSENPFTKGHYSRATAIQDKDGVFVTKTWSSANNLPGAPTTGLIPTVQTDLQIIPFSTEFTVGDIITLDATVSDNINANVASVEYLVDATSLKSYTTKPYKFQFNTVDVAAGNHWVHVKATNALGHVAQDSIKIHISEVAGNIGPSVAIWGLSSGEEFDRQTVLDITAIASDPDDGLEKVEFRVNNALVGTDDTAPYNFVWDTYNNQVGPVVLELTAYDKSGQARSDVANVTLLEPDNYIPRATITAPTNGSTFAVGIATIELTATAVDAESDPINSIEFSYRKSTSGTATYLGNDATSPYSYTFNTAALTAGTYYIYARVYDNDGRSSETSAMISIQ